VPSAQAGSASAGSDDENEDVEDDDERPELVAQLEALKLEIAAPETSSERRALAEAEATDVSATLMDLDRFESLQDELEELESLKGAARKKARPRMIEIEKELDSLEAKHKKKQIVAPPASAPDGFVALQVLTAKKSLPVLVCADEPYVRHQCTLSHERSGGKSSPCCLMPLQMGRRERQVLVGGDALWMSTRRMRRPRCSFLTLVALRGIPSRHSALCSEGVTRAASCQ
jgi:PHD/YefM family antitoxin component YafN of YafNO toxin-antitoxin module